ncbi:fatty acid oxidation complex subunit alpha FadB [Pseudoteredinibacter isoporae]|uniref:enoyl-CoA hydratase n=1 Tax=Pseudoteredinibacter isoporae TaxID=570281 RepID=A0A7X0JY35_9GAMM|nr:fatty acid oxidation complex subunit alpha FadB [Pseudoteredinibacter isoporae]MBB6523386.1 3-hydroxyacyl-CoA dehydrogenase/enoyl-CoA hydratase/3-hydroxybutyryl-CoA epimerase/enoyl-CoA isomerase [Pseudoteredinibacter isoporae]NHO88898.1 fatty acid oxidation complex subunit alpha FadB [Pseudoteredinibacter isoporae]NIB24394.1 fatty acid oxidation complex subunit alpha FadB [Pseudoteredinibacter isoporae]
MIFSGKAITVSQLDNGFAELNFNLEGDSVNKFNALTTDELRQAAETLRSADNVKGLLVTSGKDVFIVGADISEFGANFSESEEAIAEGVLATNKAVFNVIEDLPFPSVCCINGFALGGGLEMALACDYRVMSTVAKVGLPETKLGIIPGFGGTVRLPRLIGADNAIEWIASGKEQKPEAALKAGAVDAIAEPAKLKEVGLAMLEQAVAGKLNYSAKRQEKLEPLQLNDIEMMMSFETSKAFVAGQAGPHYPAPVTAIKVMQKAAKLDRDGALAEEAKGIAKLAKTEVAKNLVGLFLGDQELAKTGKTWAKKSTAKVEKAAVLGAGIMGGGIAYQSALKGTPIVMKDIAQEGLDLGLSEASKLLSTRVQRGRMTPEKMAGVLNMIDPSLSYDGMDKVDIIVEAVVENPKVKHAVLAEVEEKMAEGAVLTSNTSTISINYLAEALKRPEDFCGMHFFNPVHKMPLVEVIRGEKTNDEAVARTVAYALAMGKKPVVVNDCPGFLVNRILSPYMGAFMGLVKEGADFVQIDKVMEKFGWPMGPAYLCDVVGIDTGVHAGSVMREGFPTRMSADYKSASEVLFEAGRYGQKNDAGYYKYELDRKGRQKKVFDEGVWDILGDHVDARKDFEAETIVDRLMIPMCLEAVRCLEEGIADTANDVDMSLIYGVGFPPFRGGALHYIDDMGVAEFVAKADQYAELGEMYQATDRLREMAKNGETFF